MEASSSPQSPAQPAGSSPQSPTGGALSSAAGGPPAPLASVGKRLGGLLLDTALAIITLGIGWLIWLLIVMGRGQTPAKQLLHMRVVRIDDGKVASWGKMFVREFPAKIVIGFLAALTIYIIYLWPLWDDKNQELWDKMVGTVVVDDPQDVLDPRKAAA